jgi:hypothetical protein
MKKVIDRKLYNTDTAELIHTHSFGSCRDFGYFVEELYITKSGRFFVAGKGGARSRWGRRVDQNTWSGSSGIEGLSKEEALTWCESHGAPAETIVEHFLDMVEEA